jgi:hypothetical protein
MLRTPLIVCAAALLCPLRIAAQAAPQPVAPMLTGAATGPVPPPIAAASSSTPLANPASATPTGKVALQVIRHKLENGLRVVLNPDPTVPTVAVAVYYDVADPASRICSST